MYIIEVVRFCLPQGIFYKHTSKYSVRFNTTSFHPEDLEICSIVEQSRYYINKEKKLLRVKSLVHVITEYKVPSLQSANISVKLDDRKCRFVVFHFQNTL